LSAGAKIKEHADEIPPRGLKTLPYCAGRQG